MEAYQQAKEVILAYQTPADTAVLNWDDPTVRRMATRGQGQRLYYSVQEALDEGVSRRDTTLVLAQAGACTVLCQQSDLCLRGAHNFGNAAAAAAAATTLGVAPETIVQGLRRFRALPHRLELVATKGGVEYYNDSKATTPVSTIRALQAFEQPLILLAGGYDKGTPFDELGQVMHAAGSRRPRLWHNGSEAGARHATGSRRGTRSASPPVAAAPRSGYGAAAGCHAGAAR